MIAPHNTPAQKRAVGLSHDYLLRLLEQFTNLFGGGMLNTLICIAITRANVQHLLTRPDVPVLLEHGPVSDEMRRPASIKSIANSLGMPYETVRRHVNALIEEGYCRKVAGGVIVPGAVLASDRASAVMARATADLTKFSGELRRADFPRA